VRKIWLGWEQTLTLIISESIVNIKFFLVLITNAVDGEFHKAVIDEIHGQTQCKTSNRKFHFRHPFQFFILKKHIVNTHWHDW
jgi:hypothetical protein